jgi:nudix-type nucleoside diphosphatase (YffH/AdpP family)
MTGEMDDGIDSNRDVLVREIKVLAQERYKVEKYTIELRRRDGVWHPLTREVHWRGDSAVVLLYCPERGTVVLTRQFRLPVFAGAGAGGMMIEAPGGLLEGEGPLECIRREVEEETGFRIERAEKIGSAYMSPAVLTERVHFFLAQYAPGQRVSSGGGRAEEGEDIQVLETSLDEAFAMMEQGTICDGRTLLLLLHLKLKLLSARR